MVVELPEGLEAPADEPTDEDAGSSQRRSASTTLPGNSLQTMPRCQKSRRRDSLALFDAR